MLSVLERQSASLDLGGAGDLVAASYVLALERDARVSYMFIGALEDRHRFMALTVESALLLHAALGDLLERNDAS